MIRELKAKRYGKTAQKLNPRTLIDKDLAEEMERDCSQIYGFQLSEELLQAAHGRESHAWNFLLAWFKAFIERECEPQPNRKGERHFLKALTKKMVWNLYKKEFVQRQVSLDR